MDWHSMTPAQARALGRMSKWKSAPSRFIMGWQPWDPKVKGGAILTIVPPSGKDRRRWDISPKGKITKKER